jgi:hypothetical protein
MGTRGIRLSKKHGVNPSLITCFYCGEDSGVVLFGHLPNDAEAPHRAGCIDRQPCPKCVERMKQGIILISVRDGEEGDNPYRTGGWVLLKEEALLRVGIHPQELLDDILKRRVAFIPDNTWAMLGLPKIGE